MFWKCLRSLVGVSRMDRVLKLRRGVYCGHIFTSPVKNKIAKLLPKYIEISPGESKKKESKDDRIRL